MTTIADQQRTGVDGRGRHDHLAHHPDDFLGHEGAQAEEQIHARLAAIAAHQNEIDGLQARIAEHETAVEVLTRQAQQVQEERAARAAWDEAHPEGPAVASPLEGVDVAELVAELQRRGLVGPST